MEKQTHITMARPWKKFLVVGLLAALTLLLGHITSAAPHTQYVYNNGRFGFGFTATNNGVPGNYNTPMLNAGWYWDWTAKGASQIPPLEYMQVIHLKPVNETGVQIGYTASPTGTTLRNLLLANPGATWMIGNEPDCTAMDNMVSEWYARAYHDVYTFVKSVDPTAQVAAGNIVQPTAMRFMYLDRILETYLEEFGEPLPADLWVTHAYILCEKCYPFKAPGEPFAWGACWVPDWPSYNAALPHATFYSVYDHWNVEIFKDRLVDMRQWMYDNGYRDHPLLIAEYGVLFYEGLVYEGAEYQKASQDFMYAGFDWMRSARDPVLGYALDDDRLIQRWAWYSLDHDEWYYGGNLFSPHSHQPTAFGSAYGNYTAQITPTVDLNLLNFSYSHLEPPYPLKYTATFTIANAGDVTADALSAYVYDQKNPAVNLVQTQLAALPCCGNHRQITLTWEKPSPALWETCIRAATAQSSSDPVCTATGANLHIAKIWAQTHMPLTGTTPVSATLYAEVINTGDLGSEEPITVTFSAQYPKTTNALFIGEAIAPPVACCSNTTMVSLPWLDYERGSLITVTAATSYQITDPVTATLQSQLIITHAWAPAVHSLSSDSVTATLYARAVNVGVVDTLAPITVSFYIPGSIATPISDTVLMPPLQCCEAYTDTAALWTELPAEGIFHFCAVATTPEEISSPACGKFFVNPKQIYFPVLLRR